MRTILVSAALVVATPGAAVAQHRHDSRSPTAVSAVGPLWQRTKDLSVKSVEQLPKAMEQVDFFGNIDSRLGVLTFNLTHDAKRCGNQVVYFRLNGMVPPSSRAGM